MHLYSLSCSNVGFTGSFNICLTNHRAGHTHQLSRQSETILGRKLNSLSDGQHFSYFLHFCGDKSVVTKYLSFFSLFGTSAKKPCQSRMYSGCNGICLSPKSQYFTVASATSETGSVFIRRCILYYCLVSELLEVACCSA